VVLAQNRIPAALVRTLVDRRGTPRGLTL
jgi:hypothetical protein